MRKAGIEGIDWGRLVCRWPARRVAMRSDPAVNLVKAWVTGDRKAVRVSAGAHAIKFRSCSGTDGRVRRRSSSGCRRNGAGYEGSSRGYCQPMIILPSVSLLMLRRCACYSYGPSGGSNRLSWRTTDIRREVASQLPAGGTPLRSNESTACRMHVWESEGKVQP